MTKKEHVEAEEQNDSVSSQENEINEVVEADEDLKKKFQILEEEHTDLKERYVRLYADFENFRKRMQRERTQLIRESNEKVLLSIISFLDDFDRALKAVGETAETAVVQGFQLIHQNLLGTLSTEYSLQLMESVGQEFDPTRHEALSVEESSKEEVSRVVAEYQPGYILKDRVLRTAKVRVAVATSQDAGDADDGTEEKNIS